MAKPYTPPIPKPIKKKNKSNHKTNPRITEYIPCDICQKNPASSTHEIFHDGTSHTRNMCIDNGYQYKLCTQCHERIHKDHKFDRKHKSKWQRKIMAQMYWFDVDIWREETGLRNYLEEDIQ